MSNQLKSVKNRLEKQIISGIFSKYTICPNNCLHKASSMKFQSPKYEKTSKVSDSNRVRKRVKTSKIMRSKSTFSEVCWQFSVRYPLTQQ